MDEDQRADSETLRMVKTHRLDDPFIVAGDRAYVIGTQDGRFPDMGWHVAGEMGGVWMHPIKLLDGFWLSVDGSWLPVATSFVAGPFWAEQQYDLDAGLRLTRRQFVPHGVPAIAVRYTFHSPDRRRLTVRFLARTDFQEVWPGGGEGPPNRAETSSYLPDLDACLCADGSNPWFAVIGSPSHSHHSWESGPDLWGPERTIGRGISLALEYEVDCPAGEAVHFDMVIAGSSTALDEARTAFGQALNWDAQWQRQESRYCALCAESVLDVPDASLTRAWDWVKVTYDWLVRDVPAVGCGLGAGVDDYPWWFGCDTCYAVLGCLALGQHELALDSMDLIRRLSEQANGGGRVIHESNTRGTVTNPGRIQETPHFVATVWDVFCWTGDLAFLRRSYPFCKQGLLEWTLGQNTPDGDLFPMGEGIIEHAVFDRQCIDTAVLTVRALTALAAMAEIIGDEQVAADCAQRAIATRARLDEAFWMEDEGLYGDMLATPREMQPRLRDWMRAVEQHGGDDEKARVLSELAALLREAENDPRPEVKRPWLGKNWIVIAPLEAQLTLPDRAGRVLDRIESPEFSGPWGMYLSGIHRTHAMSINTGVLAATEIAYGRVEQGLARIHQLTDTLALRTPGAISEMSPDYGCFVQAWSGYAVAWPVVAQIFGVEPDAYRRRLLLRPHFPASWRTASLRNLLVGDARFDLHWTGEELLVTVRGGEWTVTAPEVPVRLVRDDARSAEESSMLPSPGTGVAQ
jgi:hypothetical protein